VSVGDRVAVAVGDLAVVAVAVADGVDSGDNDGVGVKLGVAASGVVSAGVLVSTTSEVEITAVGVDGSALKSKS
jgi:hypothetical protein